MRRCTPPPSSAAEPETLARRHELLPVDLFAFLGPLLSPYLRHLLGDRLGRTADNLDTQAQYLLGPPLSSALVTRVQSHRRLRLRTSARSDSSNSLIPSW